MVRSGRRQSSSPVASLERQRLLRISPPERSRKGSEGCRIGGSAREYPASVNDDSRTSAQAADPVALGAAVSFISTSRISAKGPDLAQPLARLSPGFDQDRPTGGGPA